MNRIVFRVEANAVVGFGHFMRCFAAARVLVEEYECCFAMGQFPQVISDQLMAYGMGEIAVGFQKQFHPDDRANVIELAYDLDSELTGSDIVVLDGYRFGPEYRDQLKKTGVKLVQFFDEVVFEADVDGYITPLILTEFERTRLETRCQVFDGSNGFLIRPEFYVPRTNPGLVGTKTFIYATQEKAMAFYQDEGKLADAEVVALTNERFKEACVQMGWEVLINADADEVATTMMTCDKALLPASSVALEYMAVHAKPPHVFVIADNQREIYKRMVRAGYWLDSDNYEGGLLCLVEHRVCQVGSVYDLKRWMLDLISC